MFHRVSRIAASVTLLIPATLCADHYRPVYCPPPSAVVCPQPFGSYIVPTAPPIVQPFSTIHDCPPVAAPIPRDFPPTPPTQMPPPSVKEKTEAPQSKVVTPAAAVEAPKRSELAIPSPAVPESPIDKPKPRIEEAAPKIPPAPMELKFDLPLAKPEVAKPETVAPPKLELQPQSSPLVLPPLNPEKPKKTEELKLPDLNLPPITRESKYRPDKALPSVKVIPVEGTADLGPRIVRFFNYSDSSWTLSANGKSSVLPAKSSLSVEVSTETLEWKLDEKSQTASLPKGSIGLQIVLK